MRLTARADLVPRRGLDAGDVLDRVAGDRDDHQPRERLRPAELSHGGAQGGHEPFGDEGSRHGRHREQAYGHRTAATRPRWVRGILGRSGATLGIATERRR